MEKVPIDDYIKMCERIKALEVKMNIITFIAGATLMTTIGILVRVLL